MQHALVACSYYVLDNAHLMIICMSKLIATKHSKPIPDKANKLTVDLITPSFFARTVAKRAETKYEANLTIFAMLHMRILHLIELAWLSIPPMECALLQIYSSPRNFNTPLSVLMDNMALEYLPLTY